MDAVFWVGIGIGAVLSLLASIIANLLNNKVNSIFGRHREFIYHRKQAKEEAFYRLLSDFKKGRRDKYFYMSQKNLEITRYLMVSYVAGALMFYMIDRLGPMSVENNWELSGILLGRVIPLFLFLLVLAGMISAWKLARMIDDIIKKYDSFNKYEIELRAKLPHSDLWKL